MFSIKLMGGLGNQMFIYAFAKSVEKMGYPIAFIAQDYINSRYFESQDLKSALCSLQNRVNTTNNLNNASLHSSTASNIPANNNALCGSNPPSPHSLNRIRVFILRRAFTRFTIATLHRILERFFPYKTICEWEAAPC